MNMKKILFSFIFAIIGLSAQTSIIGYDLPDNVMVSANKNEDRQKQAVTGSVRASDAIIPHLAFGGTWTTTIVATNISTAPAKVQVEVFDSDGQRMSVNAKVEKNGERISGNVFTLILPVHSTLTFTLLNDGSSNTKVGWLRYDYVSKYTDANFGGYAALHAIFRQRINGIPDKEAVVFPDWGLDETMIAPFDNTNGFVTSMAIANGSTYSNNRVIIELFDEDGALMSTYVENFPHGRHVAFETVNKWPETRNRRGTVKLSSTGYGMAAISLLFNPTGSLTSSQFYYISTY